MAVKFQVEHYEALAKAIGEGAAGSRDQLAGGIIITVGNMLAADNPNFDRERFRDAINVAFDAAIMTGENLPPTTPGMKGVL